uniref:VWFA domain-containing protein n=1 Tax=Salvator merianae TaxID=96440 RepID=A0A8D0DVM5_SALMN
GELFRSFKLEQNSKSLLHGVMGSMVKLQNGGFENIVITIHPGISEDDSILNSIKGMIKEASSYLFNATNQRFYINSVKVVIPLTWQSKPEYGRVTTESYDKADVIVADPYLKYGDDPYTLQYGGCGEPGRYIHFTPNFLTNDSLLSVYGSRGRIFVHEWAHLRWGVFDEYNMNAPFYATGPQKAEATRCSAGISGQYILPLKTGKTRKCKVEHRTGLYEAGCQFIPNKVQTASSSIMYMQSLPSVTKFCDNNTHNIQATNMQNKLCNYRSTWEVIMDSADFASSSAINGPLPDPTISLLHSQDRVVCLVLDVSGSMGSYNRIGRLKQAAEVFIQQIIEKDSWVGIVTFQSSATIKTGLKQITSDSVRETLASYLPTTAGGGTYICGGLKKGFEVVRQRYSTTEGCEIVLLTDGEDSSISSCFPTVQSSGTIIHTIALGPNADPGLEKLSNMTGGLNFAATDSLDTNGLIDAFSSISSGSGDTTQLPIQLESKGETIAPRGWLDGTVIIDKTVGNDTFFVITWSLSTYPPGIFLKDPKGRKYSEADFTIDNTNVRSARLQIKGTAEVNPGRWTYAVMNTHSTSQVLSITVTSRTASASLPPLIVKPYMNTDNSVYPSPVVIYAEVSQGLLPVIGANVTATVEPQTGTPVELQLFDSGTGADIQKNDGIYSAYFINFTLNGRYSIKVRVEGKDETVRRVRRQSQALYVPGYVEDGVVKMNAPRPEANEDEIQANLGDFSRTASGGSFMVQGVPPGGPTDVFPPCKITDLAAELLDDSGDDDTFLLSWTAPGDNYDIGKADRYEIKLSENPLALRNENFHNATLVNTSELIPESAGVKQNFTFKPEKSTKENGTALYFAIRAIDRSNNTGEVSNIARAVLFLPMELPTTPSPTTPVLDTVSIIVIAVCVSVITICLIASITVCIVCKGRKRSPETGL